MRTVKFELKGRTDAESEFLVTSLTRSVAESVRDFFPALRSLVLASSFSAMDKFRCSSAWLYGEIRVVDCHE